MSQTIKTILFLGTDGAGKTSITTELKTRLPKSTWHYFGLKEHAIPFIESYTQKNGTSTLFYKYILCPIDLYARQKKLSKTSLNIIDRFPGWAFYNASSLVSLIYFFALPKIDAVIYLNVSPETIAKRKNITDQKHVQKELKKWSTVFKKIKAKHKFSLDTSNKTVENSTDTIEAWLNSTTLYK